jgi:uncharacterized protein YuzE
MRLSYDPDTDSLYIELADHPSADSLEVSDGVVIDYDEQGAIVGIDLQRAREVVEFERLLLQGCFDQVQRLGG